LGFSRRVIQVKESPVVAAGSTLQTKRWVRLSGLLTLALSLLPLSSPASDHDDPRSCLRGEIAIRQAIESAGPYRSALGYGSYDPNIGKATLQIRAPKTQVDPTFQQLMWDATWNLGFLLMDKKPPKLLDVLHSLGKVRAGIARKTQDPEDYTFGVRRDTDPERYSTPRNDAKYGASQELAVGLLDHAYEAPPLSVDIPGTDTSVVLTYYVPRSIRPGRFIHTEGSAIRPILQHVETLYKRALAPGASTAVVVRNVAEIHWWMAHAMPFRRGSASITDALTKAIYLAHGIEFGPYRAGIQPDIVAYTLSLPDFLSVYPKLFDRNFKHSDVYDDSWLDITVSPDDEKYSRVSRQLRLHEPDPEK